MKSEFIKDLIDFLKKSPKLINDLLVYESMARKTLRMGGYDPDKIYNGFRNLQTRGLVKREGLGFRFTAKGKEWYRGSLFKYYKIKNQKWDRKWRIVIFDIPQELHKERVRLRAKLKLLGFYMLQKSVFVFPFPCEEELAHICEKLSIADYIDIIKADSVGFHEKEIKRFFNI